ncbi:MAG TPA: LCP family protein [Alloiococcus sp.]|nr:LCP family protein [Alloiococcus sp.]
MKENNTRTTLKRKRKLRKRVYVIAFILIIILAAGGYGAYLYFEAQSALNDSYEDDGREKSDLRKEAVNPKLDNVSVLIMGVDSSDERESDGPGRTDAMIFATLNKDEKSVKLVSIPRDSLVYIPEIGYETKINHAHAHGGTKAAIDTVEELFDLPVDYYVKLNFEAFIDVIDTLNGIDMDVPYEFKEQDSQDKANAIHLMPGEQTLNGEEALALARTRKKDSDVERGKRQLEIIQAIVDKSVSITSILKLDDLINAVAKNISTNLTFKDMKSLVAYSSSTGDLDIETYSIDGNDYQPSNTYYWQLDEQSLFETKNLLRNHLALPELEPENPEEDPEIESHPGDDSGIEGNPEEQPYQEEEPYQEEQPYQEENQQY